ncbi:S1 family peptidase [Pseudomonas viridiflava]|uniref:S1 family peptidase n=1 Tax=Pseudomonas viridiflava TaxID=33069 RepID=UPI000F0212FD|nr:serine protease [Pseudomonas viridiflava]
MDEIANQVYIIGRILPAGIQQLGSAFQVSADGRFATANHVIGSNPHGLVLVVPKINNMKDYQDTSDKEAPYVHLIVEEVDPTKDLAIVRTQGYSPSADNLPSIGSIDDLHIGEELMIFGFPHCPDGRKVLTYQSSTLGAKVLLESETLKTKHAVLNFQSRPGQSGSMVISKRLGTIVGLLIGAYIPPGGSIGIMGINPAALNQTTHIISAHYLMDML